MSIRIKYEKTSDPNILYSVREFNGMRVFIDTAANRLEIKNGSGTGDVVYTNTSKNKAVLLKKAKKALILLGATFETENKRKRNND